MGQAAASAFIVGKVRIRNPEPYAAYVAGFAELLAQFDGQVVAVDRQAEALEGAWDADVLVLLRFADRAAAERFWHSPEYRDLARHRHEGADAEILLFQGL